MLPIQELDVINTITIIMRVHGYDVSLMEDYSAIMITIDDQVLIFTTKPIFKAIQVEPIADMVTLCINRMLDHIAHVTNQIN